MAIKDELERQALELTNRLVDDLVATSEQVDFRAGTYLLAALAASIGERVQNRCWEQARRSDKTWDMAAAEAETLITAAWRCMETISALSGGFDGPATPVFPDR